MLCKINSWIHKKVEFTNGKCMSCNYNTQYLQIKMIVLNTWHGKQPYNWFGPLFMLVCVSVHVALMYCCMYFEDDEIKQYYFNNWCV